MNVNLPLWERLTIAKVLPKKGDLVTMRTVGVLIDILVPVGDELEELQFKYSPDGKNSTWLPEKDKNIEFTFNEFEVGIIKQGIKQMFVMLDEEEDVNQLQLNLASKFLTDKDFEDIQKSNEVEEKEK